MIAITHFVDLGEFNLAQSLNSLTPADTYMSL